MLTALAALAVGCTGCRRLDEVKEMFARSQVDPYFNWQRENIVMNTARSLICRFPGCLMKNMTLTVF